MKYVISWESRQGVTEEMAARSLQVFSKWSPSEGAHFREFLGRVDGRGGFAVVETDDVALIAKDTAPFTSWFDFAVVPVLEVGETATIAGEAMEFLASVS
ncbi:DUF3303 domain-containing protein [Nocardioides coralli]|uniref:DUF3303 domain-containing protein n=1 Tax=Nocardioides coralli TaxID=2872154 RepID=UPI001CA44872|nr:DUF3303 family protein [Nocardioides coralli]QZY28383.1 DUF3303 domain-containing protein [Nocardioides coralli]